MSQEAMKLALEALKQMQAKANFECWNLEICDEAIKALEEALAKQEQGEPVAYIHRNEYNEYRLEPTDTFKVTDLPVGVEVMLYTTPQQRTWGGLTDEEVFETFGNFTTMTGKSWLDLYRITEAKRKEKNNG
jgi:hypothetical protein